MSLEDDNKITGYGTQYGSEYSVPLAPWNPDNTAGEPISVWGHELTSPLFKNSEDIQIPFRPIEEMEMVPLAESLTEREIQMSGNGEAVIDSLSHNYNKMFDVTKNLFKGRAADLDKYLEGTKMAGQGAAFMEAQEKYGVNALFLMAIVKDESGYGNAPAEDKSGVKRYNVAGLKKRSGGYQNNASYEACIDSLGSNLSRLYFKNGRVTIDRIRQLYCRGNTHWSNKVIGEMKNISTTILRSYSE